MKKWNIGIDIIKFLAALLITNSHMESIYPPELSVLTTGGAIGDALFFFCSGFTLFLKPMGRFDSYYKKRINRIYPTVFACAIISAFVFNTSNDMYHTIIHGGGWFVSCIMIYYVIAYLIDRLMSKHIGLTFVAATIIVVIVYVVWDKPSNFSMYGHTYLKWVFFFLAMLLGAIVGKKGVVISGKKSVFFLFVSVLLYYAIVITSLHNDSYNDIQILSLIPLLGITLFMYTLCNCNTAQKLFKNRYINWVVMFVGGLCLEIYLIQTPLLKLDLGVPFPVNYIVMFALIIVSAYILRCCARIFSQTFNKQDYNWVEIFKAI
jgi:peptidoglycan/LPS O-acetylase OafA/YrhL